jgi:predicted AAA+ superfamily ATPase
MALMGIENEMQLLRHVKCGAIWEGFALEQIIQAFQLRPENCFFWRTSNGAELDLFFEFKGERFGFEFKYSDKPKITQSMRIAVADLKLDHLYVVCPGARFSKVDDIISFINLKDAILLQS